ncbi:alpha/beta hydrolase [Streptomyces sp. NPDC002076]
MFVDTPTSPGIPADNQATMFMALACGDAEWPHDIDGYAPRAAVDRKWPLAAGMPAQHPDPAEPRGNPTPWEGGLGLYKALGDGCAFVGADNGGHYVYDEGSACIDEATVGFLSTGHLRDKDVYCTDVTPK